MNYVFFHKKRNLFVKAFWNHGHTCAMSSISFDCFCKSSNEVKFLFGGGITKFWYLCTYLSYDGEIKLDELIQQPDPWHQPTCTWRAHSHRLCRNPFPIRPLRIYHYWAQCGNKRALWTSDRQLWAIVDVAIRRLSKTLYPAERLWNQHVVSKQYWTGVPWMSN